MEDKWGNIIYLVVLLIVLISGLRNSKLIKSKDALKYSIYWAIIALLFIIIYSYKSEFINFKSRIFSELSPSSAQSRNNGDIIIKTSTNGHFYVTLTINNQKIRAMIDTGATDLTLNLKDAQKIGINISNLRFNKIYNTANGISYGSSVNLEKLSIAYLTFHNIKASVNQGSMQHSLIGINFLKKFKKYQFSNNELILTP